MRPIQKRTTICSLAVRNWLLSAIAARPQELKHPDWHPAGGQLIAEGSCAGGIDLYLIDVESRDVRLVWGSEMTDGYPRWFADGKRIAFHQIDDNRNARIYVAEYAASGELSFVEAVTEGPFVIEPSPSPDGTKIAYSRAGEHGQDIAVVDLLHVDRSRVWETGTQDNFPSWHPNGEAIIFHTRDSGGTHIFQRDLKSSQVDALTKSIGPDFVGHFSRDGDRLAYSSERDEDREIYLYELTTGKDVRLTNRIGRDGYPKISPDGQKVAYPSVLTNATVVIHVMDIESSDVIAFSCADWMHAKEKMR